MIDRISAFLRGQAGTAGAGEEPRGIDQKQLAAAALLVEAAVMDEEFDERERETIKSLAAGRFGLSAAECERLIAEAEGAVAESHQLYQFTRVVNDSFAPEERVELVEMLWEVVYADGKLHDFEANLLRRLSGLLYVSDRDSGLARKRVLERRAAQ